MNMFIQLRVYITQLLKKFRITREKKRNYKIANKKSSNSFVVLLFFYSVAETCFHNTYSVDHKTIHLEKPQLFCISFNMSI